MLLFSEKIVVVPVRRAKYVLLYAGFRRGQKTYDVLTPEGIQIFSNITYNDAVECIQLHYVKNTRFPKRRRRVKIDCVTPELYKRLEHGNTAHRDATNLADYAEFSFENNDDFNLNLYSKRFA